MRSRIRYIAAVVLAPCRNQAGFLGTLVSAGMNVLGALTGAGQSPAPAPVVVTAPQQSENGMSKWMPFMMIGGGVFVVLIIIILLLRK